MSENINDLPSLDWVRELPDWVELRFLQNDDGVTLVFMNREGDLHVATKLADNLPWQICVNNLGGAIFDREHPGEYLRLVRVRAESTVKGIPLSNADLALLARQRALQVSQGSMH